jgi:hypothetical protein
MAPPAAAQQQICQDVGIDDNQGRPSRLEGRISWLNGVDTAALHLASVTLGEIEAGIELTRGKPRQGRRDRAVARSGELHLQHHPNGWASFSLPSPMVHKLTVVTRNVADFSRFEVALINPFSATDRQA